jgi:hypothetical protein
MEKPMRTRLIVDVPPSLRREIKISAARRDMSVKDYVTSLLVKGLAEDAIKRPVDAQVLSRVVSARTVIMGGQRFEDDSLDILRQERDRRGGLGG